ncbi:hypothetical protein AU490_12920 [Lonsdalea populi]|uniref:Uncharacterized protein n=1 Tax=Lonsdalea populi TaxID=1172565 RepID=A0ABX9ESC3_9GAMM|nr:hypothetical protein AU499_01795 [Lonsdalea populi]RAT17084.1 hypothetical protein AU486_06020 [Lonsdalea quercina]RAT19270.1 hypothetical protein AU487_11690 [Lonsdalea populi]RAT21365.1 hypothetical protein AU489_14785 [Lonsdalea populi]RAT27060.1 hypothetical protein AU490_12920 [Lonsdalea populi]
MLAAHIPPGLQAGAHGRPQRRMKNLAAHSRIQMDARRISGFSLRHAGKRARYRRCDAASAAVGTTVHHDVPVGDEIQGDKGGPYQPSSAKTTAFPRVDAA